MRRAAAIVGCAVAGLLANGAFAQETAPRADNSANNASEHAGKHPSADMQSNSKADIELTQRIRRSVMADKKLSVYGQNVKIVSAGGKVTLSGVVRTPDEARQIGMKAEAVAGAERVTNELEVAPAR